MSDKTGIEWTDATWNPVTGCTKVSPGCDHCYALTLAERFRGTPGHYFEHGFDVQLRPAKLDQPLRWKKPRRIFVNSMSDLFHRDVDDTYIAQVFAVMALAPQHTFQVLTKRHGRMRSLLSGDLYDLMVRELGDPRWGWDEAPVTWPLPNVWLGVSVEDQQRADLRVPALLGTPAAVRFLSCEPLLGPIDLAAAAPCGSPRACAEGGRCGGGLLGLGWVIAGGESGRGARPMRPDWVRSLRDQCTTAGVPFLFKQWGGWIGASIIDPAAERVTVDGTVVGRPLDAASVGGVAMKRVGKKAAGRELDGRTWDEFPQAVPR